MMSATGSAQEPFDDDLTFDELVARRDDTASGHVAKVVGIALVPVTIAGALWLVITHWEGARWAVFAIGAVAALGAVARARVIGSNLLFLAGIAALMFGLAGAGVFVYERVL